MLTLLLSGCGRQPATGGYAANTLRIGMETGPTNLDPRFGSVNTASYRIIEQVFRFLVRKDTLSRIIPDIADHWTMPDDSTYVFTLRDDVRFHDGTPLTSADVQYTFASILDSTTGSPLRGAYLNIRNIRTPDPRTVIFELRHPSAPFLTDLILGIVPKEAAERMGAAFGQSPVGCGPFRFVRWEMDHLVELAAFEDFYLGRPTLDGLLFRILPEASTRLFAITGGEIDFLGGEFPPEYVPEFQRAGHLIVRESPSVIYEYIGLNLGRGPLQHRQVRQALALAIDREQMLRTLRGGFGQLATGLLSPSHWAYNPDMPHIVFDPAQARALLDAAGYPDPDGDGPDVRFSLEYKCSNHVTSRQKAEAVQHFLRMVGVGVTIRSFEWATFYNDVRQSRFDMYSLQWVGISEPDLYYRLFHSAGENRNHYFNPELDDLLDAGRRTLDRDTRKRIYFQVQEILARDLPYISLWYPRQITVLDQRLKNFVYYPAGDLESLRSISWE